MRKNNVILVIAAVLFLVAISAAVGLFGRANGKIEFPWDTKETAESDVGSELESDAGSGEVTGSIQTEHLGAPSVSLINSILTIVPGSSTVSVNGYEIYVNDSFKCVTTTTTVDLSELLADAEPGDYKVKIRALAYTLNGSIESGFSNPVLYTIEYAEPTGLTEPTISLDGTYLEITSGAGTATNYQIYKSTGNDGYVLEATVKAFEGTQRIEITPMLTGGKNYFMVTAVNTVTGESAMCPNAVYYYNDITVTTLNTPSLTLDGEKFTVSAVENATGYQIYYDGNYYGSVTNVSFVLPQLVEGETYTIKVRAYYIHSEGTVYSPFSNEVRYTVPTSLVAPSIYLSGDMLTIVPPPSGHSLKQYEIFIDGVYLTEIRTLTADVAELLSDKAAGTYEITVRYFQVIDGDICFSDHSNSVYYTVASAGDMTRYDLSICNVDDTTITVGVKTTDNISSYMDEGSDASLTIGPDKTAKVSYLLNSDSVLIVFNDTEAKFVIESSSGCTVSAVTTDSNGTYFFVTDIAADAQVSVSITSL